MLIKVSVLGQEDILINTSHVTVVSPSPDSDDESYTVEFVNTTEYEISTEQFQNLCDKVENWGEQ
jgi:hypothetical protein